MVKRIPVKSSNLASVGYDEARRVLEVEFLNETIYQYSRVPKPEYRNLMIARSHGEYFWKHIRDNRYYGCQKLYPEYELLRV